MKTFGQLKQNIVTYLSENYSKGTFKQSFKAVIPTLMKSKKLKEVYSLYSQMEEKSFPGDKEMAEMFLNEAIRQIKEGLIDLEMHVPIELMEIKTERNKIYEAIDALVYPSGVNEIEKVIKAKRTLLNHLQRDTDNDNIFFEPVNEGILINLLAAQYNDTFGNITEEEKEKLNSYLTIDSVKLTESIETKKIEVLKKLGELIKEEKDVVIKNKIKETIQEVEDKEATRFNLYKLDTLLEELNG